MAKAKEITIGPVSSGTKKQQRKGASVKSEHRQVAKKEKINRLEEAKKYFKSVFSELKKVHWPTRREVLIYTGVVLVSVVIVGVIIWIFDLLLSRLVRFII